MTINEKRKMYEEGNLVNNMGQKYTKWDYAHEIMSEHSLLWEYSEYMRNTDIKEIRIDSEGIFFVLEDQDIILETVPKDERSMPLDMLNFREYEKENLIIIDKILDMILKEGGNIVDIGANIGYTVIHFAKKYANTSIIAFEPLKPTFEVLKNNISRNNLSNVQTYNCGLSNENKEVEFVYYPWCCANSSLVNLEESDEALKIKCKICRYDDITELQDTKIDFIKCDVEGNEKFVFNGMLKTLEKDKPVVVAELLRKYAKKFGYTTNEVLTMFIDLGYICFGIGESKPELIEDMSETLIANFIFLHKEKHKRIITMLLEENC